VGKAFECNILALEGVTASTGEPGCQNDQEPVLEQANQRGAKKGFNAFHNQD
jgi:hypothetical protein